MALKVTKSKSLANPDPRRGMVSASAMQRVATCPGSHELTKKHVATFGPPPETKWASSGEAIHKAVENAVTYNFREVDPKKGLTKSEVALANEILSDVRKVVSSVASLAAFSGISVSDDTTNTTYTEVRLWSNTIHTPSGPQAYSGQFDIAIVNSKKNYAIVIDNKTGWNHVKPADSNLQLKTLAVLTAIRFRVTNVYVAVIQPTIAEPSVAYYSASDLSAAIGEINSYVYAANTPNADRRPSADGCRYCPARMSCPEIKEELVKLATGQVPTDVNGWAKALEMCEIAEMVIADLKTGAKKVLEESPDAIPGWKLAPGKARSSISDNAVAFDKMKDLISIDRFLGSCKASIASLAATIKDAGIAKTDAEAKKVVKNRLAPVLVVTIGEPSLVKTGHTATTEE